MKTLVLLTSHFPFGTGESFVGAELQVLIKSFDKIIIIAQDTSGLKPRKIPDKVVVFRYNPSTSFAGFLLLPILVAGNCNKIFHILREECLYRKSIGKDLTIKQFFHLIKKIIKAIQLRKYIIERLLNSGINENIVLYSYWLKTGAHAISMLKYKKSIRIARGHGSDIYEETNKISYLPLMKYCAMNLDAIFFISTHGRKYFSEIVRTDSAKFLVSHLGVDRSDNEDIKPVKSNKFRIVSCSNLVSLKRIDLMISSFAAIESPKEIEWLHFGEGILRDELESLARKKLGHLKKVSYSFMGHYPNDELLKYYHHNKIDLFLNTSSTEGIPVSIMEAQSYGIPVIATDVGGVRELVIDGTGLLLPAVFRPEDLAKLISFYVNMPENEMNEVRTNAFNNWKMNFNASSNYEDFTIKVNSILASAYKMT